MTTKVYDTFDGTNGTDLSAHTPDTDVVGGGWSQSPANGLELDGSGAAKWAASTDSAAINAGSTNQRVSTNFSPGGADNRMGVRARSNGLFGTSEIMYYINFRSGDSGGRLRLYKYISGTATLLSDVAHTINLSSTYLVEIEAIGTAIKTYIDSVQQQSVTDSAITTGNYSGIQGFLRSSANGRFYDFTIDDTVSGAALYFNHLMKIHNG